MRSWYFVPFIKSSVIGNVGEGAIISILGHSVTWEGWGFYDYPRVFSSVKGIMSNGGASASVKEYHNKFGDHHDERGRHHK